MELYENTLYKNSVELIAKNEKINYKMDHDTAGIFGRRMVYELCNIQRQPGYDGSDGRGDASGCLRRERWEAL